MQEDFFNYPKIISTEDGSDTLRHSDQDELYHSRFGAYTEGQHIFINQGIQRLSSPLSGQAIKVLELGLGSGLNALLTWVHAESNKQNIQYTSIEKYPVHPEVIQEINFGTESNNLATHKAKLTHIHEVNWNQWVTLAPYFQLQKIKGIFEDHLPNTCYDILYYDAFAPEAQPELWDEQAMLHCHQLLRTDGIWISYCAKGYVKRNLRKAGFEVTALPGPPRKREITLAIKKG